jgi:tungstate transport system ATP-binding protein
MSPVIELSGVRVAYREAVVLEVPRLDVQGGEILAVIGPNGSGKSTLLRVIGLLETPTAGEVRFNGETIAKNRLLAVRRQMASVFQDPLLVDGTVFENVTLGLSFRHVAPSEIRSRVQAWLDRFGIAHLAHRQARTLSGGEAQRTALARALVLRPDLLLLDEPFSALDQPTREALISELARILREDRITTVFVTHDRGEALAFGDRVAVMMRGQILQLDEASRLFRAPVSEEVARFVGVETILDCRVLSAAAGLAVLDAGGQKIEVATEVAPGERVRVCLRPEDVTLMSPDTPSLPSSARNHLAGTVARLIPAGPYVRTVLDCGFPLVALVTPRSVEELGLREGARVMAAFKATAPHVIRYGRRSEAVSA